MQGQEQAGLDSLVGISGLDGLVEAGTVGRRDPAVFHEARAARTRRRQLPALANPLQQKVRTLSLL